MATITAELTGGTTVTISNGRHSWRADEPVDVGGTDLGPSPYEMLLGALAACTSITMEFYARRKGFVIDSVSTRYTYDRIHADDCESCDDSASGWLDHVKGEVFIDGDFTEEQRKRLKQIATRCPVHRTLAAGIHFDDHIVVG